MLDVPITSVAPPTIAWRCPRCRCSEFACSERFRMNTNGKLADIWLLYRCVGCGTTRNLPLVRRRAVTKIDRALLRAATVNDGLVARRLARDVTTLGRGGARIARGDVIGTDVARVQHGRFRLVFDEPLLVRLDEVLSAVTGTSRSRLRAVDRAGQLTIEPRRPLARLALTGDTTVAFD